MLNKRFSGIKMDMKQTIQNAKQTSKTVLSKNLNKVKRKLATTNPFELQKREEIRIFERALRSPNFQSKLNASLQNNQSAQEFIQYCHAEPSLKELTLGKELHRINYTLITPEGNALSDPDQIKSYMMLDTTSRQDYELLFRAANQTIFGDRIVALTSFDGLIRPQLCAGTFVDDCTIEISLEGDKPKIRAECFLNISIPNGADGRLSMAGAIVEIYFCPSTRVLSGAIPFLSLCACLTDQQVNDAAKSLAETS
jgi:hypothetical protein